MGLSGIQVNCNRDNDFHEILPSDPPNHKEDREHSE